MIDESQIVLPSLCRCENCRFWREFEANDLGDREGTCVRHVPVFIGLNTEGTWFAHPITGVNATCGEHEQFQAIALQNGRVAEGEYRWMFPANASNASSDAAFDE